ncbi:MAG TPA: endolytic transglycosylase MltG [Gammaproteobacteria bacterium]|jgi:UPF0755 protein
MAKPLVVALIAVVAIAVGALAAFNWSWRQLNEPLSIPDDAELFLVERGTGFAAVTRQLAEQGILEHPRLLEWYARLEGMATGIHAGEYDLTPGLTAIDLLQKLARGDVHLHQFTIIEGLRFAEVLEALRAHPAITATSLGGEELMAQLGRPEQHPEGQLLPETYSFPRGTRDVEVLRWSNEALWSELDESWSARSDSVMLEDAYEALILASIIEKETALDSEREQISEVFHERLRRGMRLQTDPTVIYGVGSAFDGNLTRAHLRTDTPYNTYTRRGLPPTPIALASARSIAAAVNPVSTGALYFVATGDPDGSHAFSRTLEEHNAAVSRYLQRQRETR